MKSLLVSFYKVILVFFLSNLIITLWFIFDIGASVPNITFNSIKYIFMHYGFALSIPPTISYIIIYLLHKKIQIRWIFYLSTCFIICCCFFLMAYIFVWYGVVGIIKDDLFTQ
jgi:hypothetical protein